MAKDMALLTRSLSGAFSSHLDLTPSVVSDTSLAKHNRAFQNYGNFSSGVGVQYAPSAVTDTLHQSVAENLVIGQRLLPHVLVRAADAREVNIQDLAPSDSRFKLFVFPGEHTVKVASFLERPEGFFNKRREAYSVITVLIGDKTRINYLAVPPVLRIHWTRYLPKPGSPE